MKIIQILEKLLQISKIVIVIISILTMLILLEYYLFQLFDLIPIPYSSIILGVILHYFLLRSFINFLIFPQANLIYKKFYEYYSSLQEAKKFETCFLDLQTSLKSLSSDLIENLTLKDFELIYKSLINCQKLIEDYLYLHSKLQQKFSASRYIKRFYLPLVLLNDNIKDSSFTDIVKESIDCLQNGDEPDDFSDLNLDRHIKKISFNLEEALEFVQIFLGKKGVFSYILGFFFNDSFSSMNLKKCYIKNIFNCEELSLKVQNSLTIDGILLKNKHNSNSLKILNENSNSIIITNSSISSEIHDDQILTKDQIKFKKSQNNVVILFLGNNTTYETFVFHKNPLLDFYLSNNIQVFLWNYRGYGLSQGSANLKNIKTDSEYCLDFLRKHYKWNKIAVHGFSIGGVPACFLAGKNIVDLCIIDRTFSSLKDYTKYSIGCKMQYLFKLFFLGDDDNVKNYLKSKSNKVILSDPKDEVLNDEFSLKTGVSDYILNDKTNDLYSKIGNEVTKFLKEKKKKIAIFQESVRTMFPLFNKIIKKLNLQNNEINSMKEGDSVIQQRFTYSANEKLLIDLYYDFDMFDSSGESLISSRFNKKKNFFRDFLRNLVVWGSYKLLETTISDQSKAISVVPSKIYLLINKIIYVERNLENDGENLSKTLNSIRDFLIDLLIFIKSLNIYQTDVMKNKYEISDSLEKMGLENVSLDTIQESEIIIYSDIKENILGELIPLSCGHEGSLNENENSLLLNQLKKSNFL